VIAPDFVAAKPVMFLTGSYTAKARQAMNLHYQIGVPCDLLTGREPDVQVFCLPDLQ